MAGEDDAGKLPNRAWCAGLVDGTKGDLMDVLWSSSKMVIPELAKDVGMTIRVSADGATEKQSQKACQPR
jgi:hypothetical protein